MLSLIPNRRRPADHDRATRPAPKHCSTIPAPEDQVPENHLLRLIDKHIGFEFVREQLKNSYRETRRPSIDP
jgi:transposase